MPDPIQEQRLAAFIALLEEKRVSAEDYEEDVEEDVRPYLNGDDEIGRFVAITMAWPSSGATYYFYPRYSELELAILRAEEYAHDDIYVEAPFEVWNLDTGEVYRASEPKYAWTLQKETK